MDLYTKNYKSDKTLYIYPKNELKKQLDLDLIKYYLSSQPEQIEKLVNDSKNTYETINEFIDITQNYSSNLEILALKIKPNYTTAEGQLAQAVQGILLFFSEELSNLISELKKTNISPKEDQINIVLNKFEEQRDKYLKKIKEANLNSDKFKKELQLYQEYLVNKEYKEHIKNNDPQYNDDDIIYIYKKNKIQTENNIEKKNTDKKKEEKKKINLFDENEYAILDESDLNIFKKYTPSNNNNDNNENEFKSELNNDNNEKEVITSQKLYFTNINESNDILKNIKEFLSKEKTNLRKNIFQVCDCFIEGLLKCAQNQKKKYDIQNEVIKNITNILKYEETDKNKVRPEIVRLKYLQIYQEYIEEKSDITINKKSKLSSDELGKNNNLKHFKKMKSNNILSRRNCLLINTKDQIFKAFKDIVIKLNRVDILNIFEEIKKTNIILDKSDIKFIEEETNYKVIHEILVSIFINTEKYTDKEKDILINFFKQDKIYIIYFIKVLNDHRAKGNFILSENTLKYLGELFTFINNLILNQNDMELFKYIFMLSMTYYHVTKDNMKIYLFSYIKDHPDYQKVKFWDDYLFELIEHDLKENPYHQNLDLSKKKVDNLNREDKEKLSNCYFSNFITVVKAMADFRKDKKFVRDFVEKNKEKYTLSNEQIENICMVFDISLSENEANYNGDFICKEKQNKSNEQNEENINSEKKEEKEIIEDKENEDEKIEQKENKKDNIEDNTNKDEKKEEIKIENKNIENKKENVNENIIKDNDEENNKNNGNIEDNILENENNQTNNETI